MKKMMVALAWLVGLSAMGGDAQTAHAVCASGRADLWDASVFLPDAKCPMLWVDGTNDFAFPLSRVRRSAALAAKVPHVFSTHLRMVHSHGEPDEGPREILAFADHFAREGKDVVRVGEARREVSMVTAAFEANGRKVVRAELLWTASGADVKWSKRFWKKRVISDFDPMSGSVSATLPKTHSGG